MFRTPRALALAPLLGAAACQVPEGQEWRPTLGLETAVASSYQIDVSALGYLGYTGDVDYTMTELVFGATRVTPRDGRAEQHEFAGIRLGFGELEDDAGGTADLSELSGGGHWYFDGGSPLIPFVSLWSTITDLDDSVLDPQLGLRLGGGVEYALGRDAGLTLSGDYLIPILDAEDSAGLVEASTDGFALRLGVVYRF